jgi:hypothetical protein
MVIVMALVYDNMPCALCGEPLNIDGPFVATTHFIEDESDPLYCYSDAAMHCSCFREWERREEFVEKYNAAMGWLGRMGPDGQIMEKKSFWRRLFRR